MYNKTLKPTVDNVILIEPIKQDISHKPRYAAYVRVSSSSSEQLNSYAQQISHYVRMFRENEDKWELVDVYADQGITGTSLEKRDDFNRMLNDCRLGKIDKIITKSITRFSRDNAVTMATLRELKSLGITVIFEDDKMDTDNMKSEMLYSLQGIMAQNGSKIISDNTRKGFQMRAKRGEYKHSSPPYGYDLINKELVINEEEAKIVRRIFGEYLCGKSITYIAKSLKADNIPTTKGNNIWRQTTINGILTNERVIGDMKLQKNYSTDTMPIQKKTNKGQRDMYYVENSHQPIISKEIFERVQNLLEEKNKLYKSSERVVQMHHFTQIIKCGECGRSLRRKLINNKAYWSCNNRDNGNTNCSITFIPETEIENAFIRMHEKLRLSKEVILTPMFNMLIKLRVTKNKSNEKLAEISAKIRELHEQSHVLSGLKAKSIIDSALYITEQTETNNKMQRLKKLRNQIIGSDENDNTLIMTKNIMAQLDEEMTSFDAVKFSCIAETITVTDISTIKFKLVNGLNLCEKIERGARCYKKTESSPSDIKWKMAKL